jgi:Ras-related protein Rab-1A
MYDITNQETYASVQKWVQEADRYAPDAAKLLIGNKSDLAGERQVQSDEAKEYCDSLEIPYMETSAKEGTNIDSAFMKMAECIKEKLEASDS